MALDSVSSQSSIDWQDQLSNSPASPGCAAIPVRQKMVDSGVDGIARHLHMGPELVHTSSAIRSRPCCFGRHGIIYTYGDSTTEPSVTPSDSIGESSLMTPITCGKRLDTSSRETNPWGYSPHCARVIRRSMMTRERPMHSLYAAWNCNVALRLLVPYACIQSGFNKGSACQ